MNDRQALLGPLGITVVLLACLAVVWALVSQGQTQIIVPLPEQVGESFFKDLAARDFGPATNHLAEGLRNSVGAAELRGLADTVRDSHQGLQDSQGLDSQQQSSSAQARVEVTLGSGQRQTVSVPLTQENGLWKIVSLDPLIALTGQESP